MRDNREMGKKLRRGRNTLMRKIEEEFGHRPMRCRGIRESIRENCVKLRHKVRKKFDKKLRFLEGKYMEKYNPVDKLNEEDRLRYEGVRIFNDEYSMTKDEENEPMVVCEANETIELSNEEKEVLMLGPKYCVLNRLNEETFQREVEECIVKYRWELRNMEREEDEVRKFGEDAYRAIESLFDEDELAQQDEDMRLEEAKMRMPFDQDKVSLNFGKRRATDLKGNARVFLPKRVKNFETET